MPHSVPFPDKHHRMPEITEEVCVLLGRPSREIYDVTTSSGRSIGMITTLWQKVNVRRISIARSFAV